MALSNQPARDRWERLGAEDVLPVDTIGLSTSARAFEGALFGVIASLVMGMLAMGMAALQADDVFRPLKLIAATFLGEAAVQPGFLIAPILLGLIFLMFNGAWLGALFGVITPNVGIALTVAAGLFFGLIVGVGATWVVLPLVNPIMAQEWQALFPSRMFLHVIFGLVLGLHPEGRSWITRSSGP